MYVCGRQSHIDSIEMVVFLQNRTIDDGMGNQNLHNNILIAMNSDLDLVENTT